MHGGEKKKNQEKCHESAPRDGEEKEGSACMRSLDELSVEALEDGREGGDRKRPRKWRSLLLNWLPLVLVSALFAWAYYAYVVVFCGSVIQESTFQAASFGVGFHLLLFLCLWSYAQTTVATVPPIPRRFSLTVGERQALEHCHNEHTRRDVLRTMADDRRLLTFGPDGCVRYCEPCCLIKPDRCHHCSVCRRCIPKMDHHCPWFNNCVCYSTYKFFLLTLFYTVVLSVFGVATTGKYVVELWLTTRMVASTFHLTFLAAVGTLVALGLGAFLWHHVCMVLSNETTLENMRAPVFRTPGDSFDIGSYRNFVEVFGPQVSLWMLPVFTSTGDGVRFPTKLHQVLEGSESPPPSLDTSGSNVTIVRSPSNTAVAVIPEQHELPYT